MLKQINNTVVSAASINTYKHADTDDDHKVSHHYSYIRRC